MLTLKQRDTIFLSDLRVRAIIGINDWERRTRQTVSVDLLMPADARRAARSDRIEDTLNYKAVAKRLIEYIGESSFQLVETLAERIAALVRDEFGADWVQVSVHKPGAVRGSRDVGITITRGLDDGGAAEDVYVGIGSNVEPEQHVRLALEALEQRFGPLRRSTVYRNAAVGFDGDDFLNLVAGFATHESLHAVSAALAEIEQQCGRERRAERYGPRTLDVDLLLFGDRVVDDHEFCVPREDLLDHAFVLRPLAELAGPVVHPVAGRPLAELWRASGVRGHDMTPVAIDFP